MRKFAQDEVADYFMAQGYILRGQYIDCKTKQAYTCPFGHEGKMTFDNFSRGKRCPECRIEEASERYRHSYEYVKSVFEAGGCQLLSKTYKNVKRPLSYICSCGNQSKIAFGDFLLGKRCNKCGIERRVKSQCSGGNMPSSIQQEYIQSLIGGILNYPLGSLALDIALPDEKIYVEYDGSGHDLSVKKGTVSADEFQKRQMRRNYAQYRSGWRCLRIISRRDNFPSEAVLLAHINDGQHHLRNGGSHYEIDIDKRTLTYSKKQFDVDFGELRRMRAS